jgi:hypothetical protein
MITEIEERKRIIISLKSNYRDKNLGIDKRIRNVKMYVTIYTVLTIFVVGIVLISIIGEALGYTFLKWNKMGLFVLFSIGYVLRVPKDIFELKLLNHLKSLNDHSDVNQINESNIRLKGIIEKINNNRNFLIIVIPLMVVLIILTFLQIPSDNLHPLWNYAKIPTCLIYVIGLIRYFTIIIKLNENIKAFDTSLSQSL